MNRTQWVLFIVCMSCLFPAVAIAFPRADRHPALLILPALCFLTLLGSTAGWMAVRAIRNAITRRRGVPMVGRVVHARSTGYTNYVRTWEVEAELPTGTIAKLLVVRSLPFMPGEPLKLIVDPRNPAHAALPAAPNYDF